MKNTIIQLGKLGCGACAMKIEKGLEITEGVKDVKVSMDDYTANINYDDSIVSIETMEKVITDLGYQVV